jgi:hypothetical protein
MTAADEFQLRHDRLVRALEEASILLRRHGEQQWATWLETDRTRIENGDRSAIDHVLQAFGGMGSLNDVVFHQPGVAVGDETADDTDKLRQVASVIYEEARALQRTLGGS